MDSLSWWRVWTYIFDPLPENIKNAKIGSDGPTLDEKLAQLRVFEYCFYAAFSCLWASLILSFGAYFVEARHFHFGGSNFLFEHKRHMQLYRLIQALKIVALLITIAASITWVQRQLENYPTALRASPATVPTAFGDGLWIGGLNLQKSKQTSIKKCQNSFQKWVQNH